jgi:hypothetical protein
MITDKTRYDRLIHRVDFWRIIGALTVALLATTTFADAAPVVLSCLHLSGPESPGTKMFLTVDAAAQTVAYGDGAGSPIQGVLFSPAIIRWYDSTPEKVVNSVCNCTRKADLNYYLDRATLVYTIQINEQYFKDGSPWYDMPSSWIVSPTYSYQCTVSRTQI